VISVGRDLPRRGDRKERGVAGGRARKAEGEGGGSQAGAREGERGARGHDVVNDT